MVYDVKNKTFIVTGGASGIGALCVGKFLDQGAKGVAILDIAVDQGAAFTEKQNKNHPGKAIFVKCDVSSEEDITRAFEEVVAKFKQVDVLVNNAGIMVDSPNIWRIATNVNWQGVVSFTLKGIKHMSKDEGGVGGTIVNIASTAAITKNPYLPIYWASKSAVLHFSQCIAMDPFYDTTGIRMLCICFGPTSTALLQNANQRPWDLKFGEILNNRIRDEQKQRAESAVAAVDYMLKNGTNGSIWLSTHDKPAKDITSVIDEAFKLFDKVISDNAK